MRRQHREPSARNGPRVLLVGSQIDAVGGIPSYVRSLIDALDQTATVEVVDLHLSGSVKAQITGFGRALVALARARPDLLVLAHVGLGPIGLAWRLIGGRYVVLAYGIDVWGPRTRSLQWTFRRARAVWAISTFTRAEVLRAAPGSHAIEPLGGSIAPQYFQHHERIDGPARVLFVATLVDLTVKGADTLVEAVATLSPDLDVELRVIGSGPGSPELERFARQSSAADRVTFLGRLDADSLLAEYRRGDIIVLASRFQRGENPRGEGLGLVVLEAAASEVTAIASAEGGASDTLVEGETGFRVVPGDVDALTGHLDFLLRNPDRRREMGEAGRRFTEKQHSAAAFAGRVAEAVREACE